MTETGEEKPDLGWLNGLTEELQGVVSVYSNYFLEPDVRDAFMADPHQMQEFRDLLSSLGLTDPQVQSTLRLCGLVEEEPLSDNIANG